MRNMIKAPNAVRRVRKRSLGYEDKRLGILLIMPIVIFMIFLVAYPLVNLFILSFQNSNMLTNVTKFVYFNNFRSILSNNDFWEALINTFIFSIGTLIPSAVLGTISALILNKEMPARSFIRAFVIFPYIVPMVVAAALFKYMFNDLIGILDHLIIILGISDSSINLFGNYNLAMLGVVFVSVWKYAPMVMIAVLGRIQTIPGQLYEAAQIDGCNGWKSFWKITFPYIQQVLIVVMLMRFIWLFNKWDIIYLLTGGGPLDATATLPMLLYSEAFSSYNLGKAAAIGVLMFVILAIISKVFFSINERAERRL